MNLHYSSQVHLQVKKTRGDEEVLPFLGHVYAVEDHAALYVALGLLTHMNTETHLHRN